MSASVHGQECTACDSADLHGVQATQGQQNRCLAETGSNQTGPASLSKGAGISAASAAHKHAASEAYELEDLDEEWVAMLNVLDSRLLEVHHQTEHALSCF